ncbi:MAG: hypothetical protein P0Y58_22285 [Candidatus Pseudomonas phytovorans]|uniref:Uncharacterized protein n=1 Tax=Candidatus Pseudomonas phytovorans TaxID=3121377 RepID=A0AAJ5WJ10_9PSED|nr:hypothetical protein [Pseudomonas sp.]WEK29595.1 MAG: hypothetical protein P0Y58_22285 [Pseudomonas sp.]
MNIILDHYLSGGRGRLKLVDVADRAGISRQALDRYYSDLKPYIAGKRDVADLANGNAQKAQVQTQTAINAVENKYLERIERLMVDHVKALEKAENSHITSLMNADLVLLESNKMRIALEKQTLHNAELLKQIHALELKLSLPGGPTGAQTSGTPQQDKLAFDVDIETLCVSFQRGMSFEDFEVAKSAEIKKVREKLDKYQDTPNVHVVIFADRYISRFRTFVDRYRATEEELSLIVRLPLFSRSEVQSFIRNLPSDFRKSIHTPYLSLDSERKAQRVFIYQKFPLPPMEIKGADTADTPNMLWGFDTVVTYKIKQGD